MGKKKQMDMLLVGSKTKEAIKGSGKVDIKCFW